MNTGGHDAQKKNISRWTGIVNSHSVYRLIDGLID